jgi:hypothetical protein
LHFDVAHLEAKEGKGGEGVDIRDAEEDGLTVRSLAEGDRASVGTGTGGSDGVRGEFVGSLNT